MLLIYKISNGVKFFLTQAALLFKTHPFESLFGLPLGLFFSWYILALLGIFYPAFVIFFFLLLTVAGTLVIARKPAFCNVENALLTIFLTFFAIMALTSHPLELVAEGRDQGTFINSALLLEASHSFHFAIPEAKPFFELYGPGKALNFPGLAYTASGALVPEFPLGYIAWLSGFLIVFGLIGFSLANVVLYLFSGLLFFALAKRVAPTFWSFISTLAILGGFLPLWFLSFTLSENLALFLFLLSAEALLRYHITKDRVTLFLLLGSAFALALTRIEGWAVLVIVFFIVTFRQDKRAWIQNTFFRKPLWGFALLLSGLLVALGTFCINAPYYKAIAKALLKSAGQNVQTVSISAETLPLYQVLWAYGLLLPLLAGLAGCLYLWKRKQAYLLLPFFLALPTLPYLFLPHITLDAPWMLRRFLFSLYPVLLLSLVWALALIIKRFNIRRPGTLWLLFLGLFLGFQIPAFTQFADTRYSGTLLPQVQKLSVYFSARDLVLIDKDVTGDNFMMPARVLSILHNRPAVYFFNPSDFAKINTDGFERVFLVAPQEKLPWYAEHLSASLFLVDEYTITNNHSFRSRDLKENSLPQSSAHVTPLSIVEIQ